MSDDKVAMEEARRAGQHSSVKSQVEGEVHAEIAESAAGAPPAEGRQIDQVATAHLHVAGRVDPVGNREEQLAEV